MYFQGGKFLWKHLRAYETLRMLRFSIIIQACVRNRIKTIKQTVLRDFGVCWCRWTETPRRDKEYNKTKFFWSF